MGTFLECHKGTKVPASPSLPASGQLIRQIKKFKIFFKKQFQRKRVKQKMFI